MTTITTRITAASIIAQRVGLPVLLVRIDRTTPASAWAVEKA